MKFTPNSMKTLYLLKEEFLGRFISFREDHSHIKIDLKSTAFKVFPKEFNLTLEKLGLFQQTFIEKSCHSNCLLIPGYKVEYESSLLIDRLISDIERIIRSKRNLKIDSLNTREIKCYDLISVYLDKKKYITESDFKALISPAVDKFLKSIEDFYNEKKSGFRYGIIIKDQADKVVLKSHIYFYINKVKVDIDCKLIKEASLKKIQKDYNKFEENMSKQIFSKKLLSHIINPIETLGSKVSEIILKEELFKTERTKYLYKSEKPIFGFYSKPNTPRDHTKFYTTNMNGGVAIIPTGSITEEELFQLAKDCKKHNIDSLFTAYFLGLNNNI